MVAVGDCKSLGFMSFSVQIGDQAPNSTLTQSVEYLSYIQLVIGSSPICTTKCANVGIVDEPVLETGEGKSS